MFNLGHFPHWTAGWVSPRTGLDTITKQKLVPARDQTPVLQVVA
jgi:hypothetical protein